MILMISKTDTLQEYLLPRTDGLDYEIILEKNKYGFSEDLRLELEITAGKWYIKPSASYRVKDSEEGRRTPLVNGALLTVEPKNGQSFSCLSIDTEIRLQVMDKYDITGVSEISIGSDENKSIVYSFMNFISKNHAEIRRVGAGFEITDHSSNGTFLNDRRIKGSVPLKFGDEINIFGMKLILLGNMIAVDTRYGRLSVNGLERAVIPGGELSKKSEAPVPAMFRRSPRMIPTLHTDTIKVELPPEPKFSKKRPLLMQIGPSFTMAIPMLLGCGLAIFSARMRGNASGAFMYTGLITAVGSALFGSIWAVLNIRSERREEVENETVRFDAYGNYLIGISDRLREYYAHNRQALLQMYPPVESYCGYDRSSSLLWNRNRKHSDFLFCRLGTGDIPFQVKLDVPEEKFSLTSDILRDKPRLLYNDYQKLENVPIGVDISRHRLIGIVGGEHENGAVGVMQSLALSIAANNCYTDVKMVFFYDGTKEQDSWGFAKWLPHTWSENRKVRYVASDVNEYSDVIFELSMILRHREENSSAGKDNVSWKPHYVLFVSDPAILENQLIAKYIFHSKVNYGVTTVLLTKRQDELPNECEFIIENTAAFQGFYNASDMEQERSRVVFDRVPYQKLLTFAKNITELKVQEYESESELPSSLEFLEMYGARGLADLKIVEKWYKNRTYNSMRAVIGKRSDGELCYLDIHEKYHGPHGLVAGTTGSGKSETLQTYILSLAVNFSPDDVAFFIIDFKGGGMANLFSDLPHLAGTISNLSGNRIRRAMISIKSENRRRQRIFSEYGVNNINLYTRLYKSGESKIPIPHLIIVIDEFAELKREEPDFMRELISVAQVGRSLGVHLILATQKPSGTVDDNIRSNSKFHLCLRVQDRQDSMDMLHKPDAAYLTQAGRCYLQVGNDELYELFQSGWSGAVYEKNSMDNDTGIATMISSTGRTSIVGNRIKMKRKEKERIEWYDTVIRMVRYIFDQADYDKPLGELDNDELEEMSASVTAVLSAQYDYGTSQSDINLVKNFIVLMGQQGITSGAQLVGENSIKVSVKLPELKEKTQLEEIVSYLGQTARENGFTNEMMLWLPELGSQIYWEDIASDSEKLSADGKWLADPAFTLRTAIGIFDDPENQLQLPVYVDFAQMGHIAVCGTVMSGKSTFLQTMIYGLVNRYSPDELNLYFLDFSSHLLSCFEQLPHTGGVMNEREQGKIAKFFTLLEKLMNERQRLLGGGNFSEYVKAYGKKLPAMIVVIDNYAVFREKTESAYDSIIMRLAREGVGNGIYMAVTSAGFGINDIPSRVSDNIRNVICLEMGEKFKYQEVLHVQSITVLPESGIKGRGLVRAGDAVLEFQTALSIRAEDDYKRTSALDEWSKRQRKSWKGKCALKVPCIPEKPTLADLEESGDLEELIRSRDMLPLGYCASDASIECVDLSETFCYSISGKARTGKTNVLKLILHMAHRKGGKLYVIEQGKNELSQLCEKYGAQRITDREGLESFFCSLIKLFVERNKLKHELVDKGSSEQEVYAVMAEKEPIFILIASMEEYLKTIYSSNDETSRMKKYAENITDKGELHNIYFFACMDQDNFTDMSARNVFRSFTAGKKGLHLGGRLDKQRIFNASNISFGEQSKSAPRGVAYVPDRDDDSRMHQAVIPLFGGERK